MGQIIQFLSTVGANIASTVDLYSDIINLIIIFVLNAFSTTLGNLKTVFLTKKMIRPVYAITFIDAIVFAYAFKMIADSTGLIFVVVFAAGKLFGVFLSNFIDDKLAYGDVEVSVYKHPEDGIALADNLRDLGYSVTTYKGYGINGKERLVVEIVVPRKQLPEIKEIIASEGKINMAVKDTKTYGKVGQIQI